MSLPAGSPVLTLMSGCDMDLLGVDNYPQRRCNINHTVSGCNSVSTSLCNRLYADGQVQHWCGSKDPSTLQLLIGKTTVLQENLSLSASLSTTPWKHMGTGGMIPCIFNPSTRWGWRYEEGNRPKYSLDWSLGWPARQSEAIEKRKFSLSCSCSINQPFTCYHSD